MFCEGITCCSGFQLSWIIKLNFGEKCSTGAVVEASSLILDAKILKVNFLNFIFLFLYPRFLLYICNGGGGIATLSRDQS